MSRKKLTIDNLFSERLRILIKDKLKMKQELFGDSVNRSGPYISQILTKKRRPGADFIVKLYINYGEYFEWLITGNVDEEKPDSILPEEKELIEQVKYILRSETDYSGALEQNVKMFYRAVKAEETNRRKGDRRNQDADYNGEDRRKGERRQKTASGG